MLGRCITRHAIDEESDRKHDAIANIESRPQTLQDYLLEQLRELVTGINITAQTVDESAQSTMDTTSRLAEASAQQAEQVRVATDTINYYNDMVDTTFDGSMASAQESSRLYLVPGMGHCSGGPGPNTWDKLVPLVDWVENGVVPDSVTATHSTDGRIDNERPLCSYPEQARYVGPAGGANNPVNWRAENFQCQ